MEKRIVEFVKSYNSNGQEENVILVEAIALVRNDRISTEFVFLKRLGFSFNQIDADFISAELKTPNYEDAMSALNHLHLAGYSFEGSSF